MKLCKPCDTKYPKTSEYFFRDKYSKDGFKARCKTCEKNKVTKTTASKKGYKKCTKCKIEYAATLENFREKESGRNGLTSRCRKCLIEVGRQYKKDNPNCNKEYYEANKTEILKKNKAYYEENKEWILERNRVYGKFYYKENIEKIEQYRELWNKENSEYYREYYEDNKEEKKRYYEENKSWLLANQRKRRKGKEFRERENKRVYHKYHNDAEYRNKLLVHMQKRRTLKAKQKVDFDANDWIEVRKKFKQSCAYCGARGKLTMDHVIAISKGGGLTKDNIIPCCGSCNSSKNNRDMQEWYKEQEFYDRGRLQSILRNQREV